MPAVFLLFSSPASADLPLTVENLLSDKGKLRLELSASYANSERRGVETSDPVEIQTGANSFVYIPTLVGERLSNSDALVTTAGIRYGLTKDTEIYARASAIGIDRRAETASGDTLKDSESRFADAWLGVNQRIRDDADKPALFVFGEIQAAERQDSGKNIYGKSLTAGFTTYQTYDPVVLSLTGAAQLNATRKDGSTEHRPGNSLSLSPSVGFAVNDKVTLTTGLTWRLRQADNVDGKETGIRRTTTSLDLGLGYALGKRDTLNLSARPQVSGNGDVQVVANWIHRLEK
ncbi:MAG: transporter [Candidatus Thiothrix putei]|uniref:Transporter n=1 Tax=Candidatus Thiothrix putei TaxID=3080811 RepID=A0AA95HBR9_9GAMM|nr:MAG: transporter [Candidatus Thiothrix putei]